MRAFTQTVTITAGLFAALLSTAVAHTWLFTRGRATMEASLDRPFRVQKQQGGLGTHAQIGPGQDIIVRWASRYLHRRLCLSRSPRNPTPIVFGPSSLWPRPRGPFPVP